MVLGSSGRPCTASDEGRNACGLRSTEPARLAQLTCRKADFLLRVKVKKVVQHLGKARANSETEGAPLFHALLSTARRPAGRLGGPAAALRPPTAVGAPCG